MYTLLALEKTNIMPSAAVYHSGGTRLKLGNNLKRFRFEYDYLSQAALAGAIGVSRQTIIAIEKGRLVPSILLALRVARFFRAPVDEIFFIAEGEWPPKPKNP
jgi:putative transcriptional regulator